MLQYLLNATAIWLLSLALFDLFLRKESYHNYNRFYLLFTFSLGAYLPLLHWQQENAPSVLQSALPNPIQQIITAKQNIVNTATVHISSSFDWAQLFMIIYFTGVAIALYMLLVDIIKLFRFYNNGNRSKHGNWTIIETGKDHAPFSFLSTLFIHSTAQYDKTEWGMIFTHEKRHYTHFHFADLMLMQLARITCWFHPLVYIYNKRLLLVHEYQADKTPSQPEAYGKFLIEQAILHTAPALSHPFNRSPIKNRIVMLTRRSSVAAKSKMLICLPLALVCILCFSKNSFSQKPERQGNILKYNGNTFEFAKPKQQSTITEKDSLTGETHERKINWADPPIKLNGEKIYEHAYVKNVSKPAINTNDKSLCNYVMRNMETEFAKLKNGEYFLVIGNVVINTKGKIVYFENDGLFHVGSEIDKTKKQVKEIDAKLYALLNNSAISFQPAILNGSPVNYLISNTVGYTNGETTFTVNNHKVKWYRIEEQ